MKSNPMEVNTNTRMRWEVLRGFPIVQAIANKSVLDIGAGLGYFSSKFAGLGANVIAVDIDRVSLKYVSDHYDISTQCADIETDDLHYKDVDLVFIGEVLEHIKDPSQFLRKVRGCLKKRASSCLRCRLWKVPSPIAEGRDFATATAPRSMNGTAFITRSLLQPCKG